VTGEINISDCVWNVSKVVNEEQIHFKLDGGKMICNNMAVTPFESNEMRFLSYRGDKNISIDCVRLMLEGFKGNSLRNHITLFGGESKFTDTVRLILITYNKYFYFFRYLKIWKVKFFTKVMRRPYVRSHY
jgi:hypothetical protein